MNKFFSDNEKDLFINANKSVILITIYLFCPPKENPLHLHLRVWLLGGENIKLCLIGLFFCCHINALTGLTNESVRQITHELKLPHKFMRCR